MKVLVIGGGAAGLMAAIAAAQQGADVLLAEKKERVGKKLLTTGNGRCNLLNSGKPVYYGDPIFAKEVLAAMPYPRLSVLFEQLGLAQREEEAGRVYPASGQAASVLDVLRLALAVYGVQTQADAPVTALVKTKTGFLATVGQQKIAADRVIVATGGMAAPKTGSDGSGYALLGGFGHTIIKPFPALSQIRTDVSALRGLAGQRAKAQVTVTVSGKVKAGQEGEVLFTDYGISGVCAMQLARFCQGKNTQLHVSLLPALCWQDKTEEEMAALLAARREYLGKLPLENYLTGLTGKLLGAAVLRYAGVGPFSRPCSSVTDAEIDALISALDDFCLPVTGVNGFDQAQVTAGGADTARFTPADCQSMLCPGLYAAGEILNVDGDCGGFNLMFAFASGYLAGQSAGKG